MFGFSLVAAGAVALAAAQGSYPAAAVLGEFKSTCIDQPSLESIIRTAGASGWQRFTPPDGTPIAATVAAGQKMLFSVGLQVDMPTYWKEVEGRRLEMVLSSAPVPFDGAPRTMTACNIYDFKATAPLPQEMVRSWAGREPTKQTSERGLASTEWKPGLADLPSQTRVGFIPDIPELKGKLPFTGIGLSSSIFEEAK